MEGRPSLAAVTALGPEDAWAVGSIAEDNEIHTLTLHWDGTEWTRVPSPNRTGLNILTEVAGSSPSDVWAVGYDRTEEPRHRTMAMHWDGATWELVPTPDPGIESLLNGVAVVSPSDVWAVGSSIVELPLLGQTLALHWDGESWSRVPSPNPSQTGVGSNLHSVDVAPGGALWAAGAIDQGDFVQGTMVIRWTGERWEVVPTPNPNPAGSLASSLTVVNRNHVWTVGWQQGEEGLFQPLAMQRRAGRWQIHPVSTEPGVDAALGGATSSRGRVWVVGHEGSDAIALRRDGRSWTEVPPANPGTLFNDLGAITAIPRSRCLWAVGTYSSDVGGEQALIERHCPS